MQGDWRPTATVFQQLLSDFLDQLFGELARTEDNRRVAVRQGRELLAQAPLIPDRS